MEKKCIKHQRRLRAAPQQWGCTAPPYLLPPFKVNAGFGHPPGGLCGHSQRRYPHIVYICCMQPAGVGGGMGGWGGGGGGGGCWLSHRVSWCPRVCLHNVFLSLSSMCRFHPRSSPRLRMLITVVSTEGPGSSSPLSACSRTCLGLPCRRCPLCSIAEAGMQGSARCSVPWGGERLRDAVLSGPGALRCAYRVGSCSCPG